MTREETAERIKIMQAYVDGKRIQYTEDVCMQEKLHYCHV